MLFEALWKFLFRMSNNLKMLVRESYVESSLWGKSIKPKTTIFLFNFQLEYVYESFSILTSPYI